MLISQATDDFDADMLETRKSIRWCQKIEPQGIFELADPPFPESDKRCFGYSRNHRPNCVQIVIALVVTPDGLPLAYEIEAARAKALPVIYTTGERRADNWDVGSWRWKSTRGDEAERFRLRWDRWQRNRYYDCARIARYPDQEAEAVGLLWDNHGWNS